MMIRMRAVYAACADVEAWERVHQRKLTVRFLCSAAFALLGFAIVALVLRVLGISARDSLIFMGGAVVALLAQVSYQPHSERHAYRRGYEIGRLDQRELQENPPHYEPSFEGMRNEAAFFPKGHRVREAWDNENQHGEFRPLAHLSRI